VNMSNCRLDGMTIDGIPVMARLEHYLKTK
jgi:hypothetical protein